MHFAFFFFSFFLTPRGWAGVFNFSLCTFHLSLCISRPGAGAASSQPRLSVLIFGFPGTPAITTLARWVKFVAAPEPDSIGVTSQGHHIWV